MSFLGKEYRAMLEAEIVVKLQEVSSKFDRLLSSLERSLGHQDIDRSMTTKEAAAFLAVNDKELLRYTKAGLPYIDDMGKGFRFMKRDLIEFRERFKINGRYGFDDDLGAPAARNPDPHTNPHLRRLA
jgi:hypothetical protein